VVTAMMRQLLLAAFVCAGTMALWLAYVPSASAFLDRAGVLRVLGIASPAEADDGQDADGSGEVVRVIAEPVQLTAVADRITAIGDGQARRTVTVTSEVAGRITDISVVSGDYVESGAALARLDDEAERIAVERAEIMREDAARELTRLTQLAGTGAVTDVRLQEARLAMRTAELQVDEARYDLRQRAIRAPIAGWLGVIDIEVGERVDSQTQLARITDRSTIIVDFRVPERVIGQLALDQQIEVMPLAMRDTTLPGRVRAIDNVVDRASRTLRVQAEIDNREDMLRGGMAFAVEMEFPGDILPAIDPLAVQWSRDGSFVWTVRDGAAVRVPILIRQRMADAVLVEGELGETDIVITEGLQDLRPGQPVEVADPPDEARTAAQPDLDWSKL